VEMLNISTNIYSKPQNRYVSASPKFTGLSHLPKAVDTFVSSELKAPKSQGLVKDVVDKLVPKPSKKHSAPALFEDLHKMIMDVTSKVSDATGKDAVVFSVPEHDDLVLRVEKSALENIGDLSKNLTLVPIKYDKEISSNKHLGLPLYYVADKESKIGAKRSLSPVEALAQPDKIMLLKKVKGQHPSKEYFDDLAELMGVDEKNPDQTQLYNFFFLGRVRANYGNESAIKFLESCKNGVKEIKPNELAEGSGGFVIKNGEKFYANYKKFAKSYIKSLKDISEIPQQSYNDAVDTIITPKDFIMDFQHTNNTFVDLENKEFNFMDFVFDKKMYPKYHYDNPVKEFRNVLMGKCFSSKFKTPRALIMYPEDIKEVKIYSNAINEKVNSASPERFQSPNPFVIE
jgi:hypothetical protein